MKSASGSPQRPKQSPNWRLKKTLARKPRFRPIEDEDIKFAYAAYKRGTFDEWFDDGLTPKEFHTAFHAGPGVVYHAIWTFNPDKPIGMAFGFYAHPDPALAPYLILDRTVWFDWSTPRQRVEHAVNLFNEIRQEVPTMGFASKDDKGFFEMICKHGIIRRVGTSHLLDKAVFETRA